MNKKIFTLFVLLLLLPVTALAVDGIELYVGGQQITESGCYENKNGTWTKVDGTEPANGQFSYDAGTFTLTLNQAKIVNYQDVTVGGGFTYPGSVIAFSQSADVSLTIVVSQGTSNITGTGGIRVVSKAGDASLSISGPGSLEVNVDRNDSGITLIGSKNVNLNIDGADVKTLAAYYYGVDLHAGDGFKAAAVVNNGKLTAGGSGGIGIYYRWTNPSDSGTSSLTVSGNAVVDTRDSKILIASQASEVQVSAGSDGNGGIVFDGKSGTVYGDVTLQEDLEIGTDETLTIGKDASLTVPDGKTLTNNGKIINYGTINGTVTGKVAIPLTEDMITVADATYTGVAVTPDVKVEKVEKEDITYTYTKDADYTVSYSNNVNAGKAIVTVTPIEGSLLLGSAVTKEFTIEQALATLSFTKETISATIGETVENTLTVTPAGVAVSYSSSEETVATVDASTGVITLVGAGKTTITATINDPNYTGDPASYTLMVSKVTLAEDEITAVGVTNISIEKNGTPFKLTAQVTANDLGTGGKWEWTSDNETVATVAAEQGTLRAATSTSSATVTPLSVGTATITATYEDNKYVGSVTYTVTVTKPYVPDPISYYNIYVEDVCDGVEVSTSKQVVREGGSITVYVEKDTANYTFDNFKVYYKRSYYGGWEELKEGTQPGEYPIKNIWTHIYIKAEGAEEKEDPTGIESIEGVKVYTKDGSLYVQTPQREQVIIVSMSGAVVKNEEQIGLKQYHGLQPGIYIVRVGDRAYKVRLN